jgi:fructosamine-3-kinase
MYFDLPPVILQKCNKILDAEIRSVRHIGGGDINQARLLETSKGKFFLKINSGVQAGHMFETEAKGLQLLAEAAAIRTPAVIGFEQVPDGAFLLLEFIETGYRKESFWEDFGAALAALHRHTAGQFGLDHDNFIGSLPQSNRRHEQWPDFYIQERLQPQLDLAEQSGRLQIPDFQNFEKLFQKIPALCPKEPPALVHGDLWSGNFMVDAESRPVLVDPSVAYSHREMDLAMSRLFGGFDRSFYRSYEATFPIAPGFEERLPLYQLYYLLVHVNLFGGGYIGSVRSVLRQFV